MALVSLLLADGLAKALPGSGINDNPNQPADPAMQAAYNRAAVQAGTLLCLLCPPRLSIVALLGTPLGPQNRQYYAPQSQGTACLHSSGNRQYQETATP